MSVEQHLKPFLLPDLAPRHVCAIHLLNEVIYQSPFATSFAPEFPSISRRPRRYSPPLLLPAASNYHPPIFPVILSNAFQLRPIGHSESPPPSHIPLDVPPDPLLILSDQWPPFLFGQRPRLIFPPAICPSAHLFFHLNPLNHALKWFLFLYYFPDESLLAQFPIA